MKENVTPRDSAVKILFMLIRGFLFRPFFKKKGGIVLVGKGVRIRNPSHISYDGRLILEDYCEIQGISQQGIIFGNNVSVGSFTVVRPSGYYSRQIGQGLVVGDNSSLGINCYIGCGGGVTIGKNVMMGPYVSIHSENHNHSEDNVPMKDQGVSRGKVVIEDDCWLGAGSRILSGVTIGQGSIVAAGAIVTKSCPPYSKLAGVPAKIISKRQKLSTDLL